MMYRHVHNLSIFDVFWHCLPRIGPSGTNSHFKFLMQNSTGLSPLSKHLSGTRVAERTKCWKKSDSQACVQMLKSKQSKGVFQIETKYWNLARLRHSKKTIFLLEDVSRRPRNHYVQSSWRHPTSWSWQGEQVVDGLQWNPGMCPWSQTGPPGL